MKWLPGLIMLFACMATDARAAENGLFTPGDRVQLYAAPYVFHYSYHQGQNPYPWFLGVEWESARNWEVGAAYFSNSYHQPSGYLYGGKRFTWGEPDRHVFLKLTLGALLGYVPPHEDKIPVNHNGIGLGIVPSVGYKHGRFNAQIAVLSISGLMMTVGYDIWK